MNTSTQQDLTNDIEVNVLTSELLDSLVGRRVVIGESHYELLKGAKGAKGHIVHWKPDIIVPSEVLFSVRLDSGRVVACCFYELQFPIESSIAQNAQTAEGRSYA